MRIKDRLLAFASQRMPRLSRHVLASAGFTLDPADLGPAESYGEWTASMARRQDRAWQAIVADVKAGNARGDVEALYQALIGLDTTGSTLLEVGCGGGYYSEIIAHRFPAIRYTGLDLSSAGIELAREHYPEREFVVGSAYELPFADDSYDIVLDGVALLQMPEWRRAIPEYARTARSTVILHGVTVTDTHPSTLFAKYAYGSPSYESVFNREELLELCSANGLTRLRVIPGLDYDLEKFLGIPSSEETWVLDAP
jgi:ubiquinone/menaquinone biosynthesis C-methylase UbiE